MYLANRLDICFSAYSSHHSLFIVVITFIVDDIEESELVDALAHADNPQPIPQLLLLEELLGPVKLSTSASRGLFQISLGGELLTGTSSIAQRTQYA